MLKPCVVFDLDGTLADTSADLLNSANACFRDLGHGDLLVHPADAGVALRGGRMMLRTGFARVDIDDESLIDAEYPKLLEHYDRDIDRYTTFYPGAIKAVRDLRAAGFAVAICTNKPEGLARKLMQSLLALDDFDCLIGADTLPVRKPDPAPFWESVKLSGGDPKRCCLIGDSITDHDTARAAGVPSILVKFGPSGEDMVALEPDALLGNFAELLPLMQKMLA